MLNIVLLIAMGCTGGDNGPDDTDQAAVDDTDDTDMVDTDDTDVVDTDDTDPPTTGCVPIGAVFDENIVPILESKCWSCHGETPEYGAPYAIVDYDDLIAGTMGDRKVDIMLERLMDFSMPPSTSTPLNHADLDTLIGWTSCGVEHPDDTEGLVVNRDVWAAGPNPPMGTVPIELTADEEVISPTTLDDYRDWVFTNIVDDPVFIQRIEPILDDTRVLHHITLTRGTLGFPYLYAWAPGTEAIQLDDGGFLLEPNDTLRVEIHYNNGAGVPDAVDSSGIRLWVGDPVGTEYGMMSPQTWNINVPPMSQATADQSCNANMDFDIIAGMPHMHEIGDTFVHEVERNDGTIENIIDLSGWSFESQFFYEMPVHINAGDTLRMTCGYDNPTGSTVRAGTDTADEMCFDFMVVKPAAAALQCLSFF